MINFEKTLFIWFYFEQIQFANKFTQIPQILLNYHLSFSLFFPQIFSLAQISCRQILLFQYHTENRTNTN